MNVEGGTCLAASGIAADKGGHGLAREGKPCGEVRVIAARLGRLWGDASRGTVIGRIACQGKALTYEDANPSDSRMAFNFSKHRARVGPMLPTGMPMFLAMAV